jgi:hypothetical protein
MSDLYEESRRFHIEDEFSLTHTVLGFAFSGLELFRVTFEDLLLREETAEVNRLAEYADTLPEGQSSEFWAENHPYQWNDIIAPQFRLAFFLSLMGTLEHHLGFIVRNAELVARVAEERDISRGSTYQVMRKRLRASRILGPPEPVWQRILDYNELRNVVAHNGAYLTDSDRSARVRQLAARKAGITTDGNEIELSADFVKEAFEECRDFIFGLHGNVADACRGAAQREDI